MRGLLIAAGASCLFVGAHAAQAGDCPHLIDQNGDLTIDGADLGALLGAWGPCVGYCTADLNGDGLVDGADLGELIAAWGPVALDPHAEPYGFSMLPGPAYFGSFDVFDADGDGDVDVVSVQGSIGSDYVVCHLNDGTGQFTTVQSRISGGPGNTDVVMSFDANGDALPDLAVAWQTQIEVCVNLGGGRFAPAVFSPNGPGFALCSIDVDSDGKRELLLGYNPSVSVGRFNGTALQYSPAVTTAFAVLYGAVGDLDSDGDEDAVVSGGSTGVFGVQVLRNDNGTLVPEPFIAMPSRPYGLAVVDVDGDGALDIMVSRSGAGGLCVYKGNGLGVFGPALTSLGGGVPVEFAVGDLNGDGRPDVFGKSSTQSFRTVMSSYNMGGTFQKAPIDPTVGYDGNYYCRTPRIADLDGDCHGEALITLTGGVVVLKERGNTLLRPFNLSGTSKQVRVVTDLDGDGHDDIVRGDSSSSPTIITWGDGTNLQGTVTSTTLPSGANTYGFCVVDIDADGRPDLVSSSTGGSAGIKVWHNLGGRQFSSPTLISLTGGPSGVMPMRVNSDAYGDVVSIKSPLRLYKGLPDGSLQFMSSGSQSAASGVAVIDLDSDGDDDILVSTLDGQIRVWMNNNGTIVRAPERDFGSWWEMLTINAVDFDSDGDLDVVEWHLLLDPDYGVGCTVWRNDGFQAGFERVFDGDFNVGIGQMLVVDMDGDGRDELVSAGSVCASILRISSEGVVSVMARMPTPGSAGIGVGRFGPDSYQDIVLGSSGAATQLLESSLPVR